ncbi:DUF262 domain-containing protein [Spiroplasma endosymbiont of Cantharis lateralis]|uniref:DUF262 domain-containing protein n=1 Tax=Spiroplasma endosymbiont of Cantharis lateralis TaxID=3066277 RepID=UPI00313A7FE1
MEIKKMSATQLLLSNLQFVIPTFQRQYRWGLTQLEQFMESLEIIQNKGVEEYFIGSIIVSERPSKLIVLDGQQRLTTMFIYTVAFSNFYKNHNSLLWAENNLADFDNKIRFINNKIKLESLDDDKIFLFQLFNNEINELADNKIAKAYNFFLNYFQKNISFIESLNFLNLFNKLSIAFIKISDPKMEQLTFESINSTGKPLSLTDLVRNFILMGYEDPIVQHSIKTKKWDIWSRSLGEKMDDFLIKLVTIWSGKQPSVNLQKDGEKMQNNYREIYDLFKKYSYENFKDNYDNLIIDMDLYVVSYLIILKGKFEGLLSKKFERDTINLKVFNSFNITGYLQIYLVKKMLMESISKEELEEYTNLIANFYIRRIALLPSSKTKDIQRKFPSIVKKLRDNEEVYRSCINYKSILKKELFTSNSENQNAEVNYEILKQNKLYDFSDLSLKKELVSKYYLDKKTFNYNNNFDKLYEDFLLFRSSTNGIIKNKTISSSEKKDLGLVEPEQVTKIERMIGNFFVFDEKPKKGQKYENNIPLLTLNYLKNSMKYEDIVKIDKNLFENRSNKIIKHFLEQYPYPEEE